MQFLQPFSHLPFDLPPAVALRQNAEQASIARVDQHSADYSINSQPFLIRAKRQAAFILAGEHFTEKCLQLRLRYSGLLHAPQGFINRGLAHRFAGQQLVEHIPGATAADIRPAPPHAQLALDPDAFQRAQARMAAFVARQLVAIVYAVVADNAERGAGAVVGFQAHTLPFIPVRHLRAPCAKEHALLDLPDDGQPLFVTVGSVHRHYPA